MVEWPFPKNLKELRGLTGFYRRFIKGYGVLAHALTQLLKKGDYQWTKAAQQAFDNLKRAMTSAPVLALPDFDLIFEIESDASQLRIGVVLTQAGRPIAYYNKALAPKRQVLSVYKKEMLAILSTIKKWNAYLVGRHFKIKTDHFSL